MKHLMVLADLLASENLAEIGVDIFINTIPADTVKGIMLRGPLIGDAIDQEQLPVRDTRFQVIVRDPSDKAGYDRSLEIAEAITMHHKWVDDVYFIQLVPMTDPVSYRRSEGGTVETSTQFKVVFARP